MTPRAGTHPSLGTRRSVLNWNLDSTGSTVHADLPLPRSSEESLVLVYLGDRGGRRTVSRQRRREKNYEVERRWLCRGVEALARHAVRGRKGRTLARYGNSRVRRLNEVVRVRDVGGLDGEVLDEHRATLVRFPRRPAVGDERGPRGQRRGLGDRSRGRRMDTGWIQAIIGA